MATLQNNFKLAFLVLFFGMAWSLLASPIRDDLAARGTSSTPDRPYAAIIEYLESTGTQYIDTGITASTEVRPLEIGFQGIVGYPYLTTTTAYFFGGGDSSSSGFGFRLRDYGSDSFTAGFGWTGSFQYWNRSHRQPCETIAIIGKILRINGTGGNGLSFSATYSSTFALFGRNVGGVVEPIPVRIYYAKIGDLDLLPVRIGNEGFMLDTVSGELFANQGTGSFILGPDL